MILDQSKVEQSANGAEHESQGQARSEARRPWVKYTKEVPRPEGPKYLLRPFRAGRTFLMVTRGDVPTKSGLAPGFHIPRLWRSDEP